MSNNSQLIIYQTEDELFKIATCKDFLHVQNERSHQIERRQKIHNLGAMIPTIRKFRIVQDYFEKAIKQFPTVKKK